MPFKKWAIKKIKIVPTLFSLTSSVLLITWSSPTTALAQDGVDDYFYLSELCLLWKDLDSPEESLAACDRAIGIRASERLLWKNRADILVALKQYAKAVISYSRYLTFDPNHSDVLTQQCFALVQLENSLAAVDACGEALRIDNQWEETNPAIAWNYQGIALAQLDKQNEALLAFANALELNPDYAEAWASRCQLLWQIEDYTEALTACDRALITNQNWGNLSPADAWATQGEILYQLARYDQAINAYNQALAINPNLGHIWTQLGQILDILGQHEEAKVAHAKAVALNPDSAIALLRQCTNLNRLNDYEPALAACELAITKILPQSPNRQKLIAWDQQGNALIGLGRYNEALAAFNRAIALSSTYADAWSNRSVALWHLGRFEEALASSDRALTIAPNSSLAWYNKGRILTTQGDLVAAAAAYDRALKGETNLVHSSLLEDIWINLSAVLLRLENYREAVTATDNALALNPDLSMALYNQALALTSLGSYLRAIDLYDEAIATNPENADFWAGKGIALQFLQRYPEALASFEKALEFNPTHPQALVNRDLLQQALSN
ncbi:MAG: tetratricopeptide repeat protein [Jaaginema sp. PMC 1080.18]|nr:tetratricopeptide repeat protein [Jaaginema sp. PMC 1080.18]